MYCAVSFNIPPYILIGYLKGTLPSPSCDTTAVTVGVFIGGAIFGAVTVVLVGGIVCGVFKLRRNTNNRSTKQERFVMFILTMRCDCDIRTPSIWGVSGIESPPRALYPFQQTPN